MTGILVAMFAALSSLFLVAQSAAASAPSGNRAAAPYPPVFCPTIAVSTTHAFPGETIAVTGQGFDGVQALTLVLTPGNDVLGHVSTNSAGTFSTHVTLPAGATGTAVIHAEGSGSACPVGPIQIGISSGTPHTPQSPLPFTGVDVLTAIAIALALIGVGLLLTRGGRRSRSHHRAHGR
ncbi:MAG TPA: hypothetical protein VGN35_08740 [Jatrophihabitantaceae bacterium]|jgi:hypothetical protein|nr:hypothetical protein [Jatrophihabitantaceae bacterium]